jgi:hypothetical protein
VVRGLDQSIRCECVGGASSHASAVVAQTPASDDEHPGGEPGEIALELTEPACHADPDLRRDVVRLSGFEAADVSQQARMEMPVDDAHRRLIATLRGREQRWERLIVEGACRIHTRSSAAVRQP